MSDYMIFVDETVPDTTNPYLCFAGIIVSRKDYENVIIPKVNALKTKHFGTTGIVFHFAEMRKAVNQFSCLADSTKRTAFWHEYVALISSLPFTVLGVYFDPKLMTAVFPNGKYDAYEVGFISLLDNVLHFLRANDSRGQMTVESRTFAQNAELLEAFLDYKKRGSLYLKEETITKHLSSLGFITKKDNCIGLQLADLVPGRLLRVINSAGKDSFNLAQTLSSKIYLHGTEYEKILGLKNIFCY